MRSAAETEVSLVLTAAEMFGRDGYATTSLDDVARAAGLSRGAVYHHFGTKAALFKVALIHQERRLAERFVAASSVRAGWDAVRAGCAIILDGYLDPAMRRILLIDGPAVLGWQEVRSIEDGFVGELLRRGLQRAGEEQDVEARLSVLRGALAEAGLLLTRDEDALPALTREIELLISTYERNPAAA
ncbi:helix-turn-helix domain-containing protein [Actinoplanes sp. NPDC026619]|uniref:TetR/AcrR family transcriptional regulator n=1 Tax=Actinoplanes sp. NPDC026619 TaxID=3155798 RepID=UPI00340F24EE